MSVSASAIESDLKHDLNPQLVATEHQLNSVNARLNTVRRWLPLCTTRQSSDIEVNQANRSSTRPSKGHSHIVTAALAIVIICLVTALITSLIRQKILERKLNLIESSSSSDLHVTSDNICVSEDCVRASYDLVRNMDMSVNPCDDFYSYACGRWSQRFELPDDKSHYDTFGQMKDHLKGQLRDLLMEQVTPEDSNATRSVKNLFASCMNETSIEAMGGKPLLDLLDTLGGWPVIKGSKWSEKDSDWVEIMAKLRLFNNDILVGEWVGPDTKNSSVYIIQFDQAELGMPSKEYFEPQSPQLEAYSNFMVQVATLLGADQAQAKREMSAVIEFEKVLSNITIPSEQRRNYSAIYNKITIGELIQQVPGINWKAYLNIVLKPFDLTNDEPIVVYAIDYFKQLAELVRQSEKRTVINYLLWRFVYNRVGNLASKFLEHQQTYFKTLYGTTSKSERFKTCSTYVNKNMGMAVGALFVKRHFNEQSKERAEEMIKDIKSSFLKLLAENDWMDLKTKETARSKAQLMTEKIGYPDYIVNTTELDKDYDGLSFTRDTYFLNVISALQSAAKKEQAKLRTPVDRTAWVSSPAVVNAFYTRSKNFITFPAGILQPPLYHPGYPNSLNYGGIGVVIGHEVTHGFDDKGRQFDANGNLKQWWAELALKNFQEKSHCMVGQYSKYVLKEVNLTVNGLQTMGENIADNGGVKQAFKAYGQWRTRMAVQLVVDSYIEPRLPGLSHTHEQLFFLNYAQIWCGVSRPEAAINSIRTGAHSPGRFRVIGALSNSREFADAYRCPAGSNMNPIDKCDVW